MPITVALAFGNESFARANQPLRFVATVTNGDAAAVTLRSLVVSEDSRMGAIIEQPTFLLQGQPWDASQPTINAAASASYPFSVVVPSPNMPGPSATNPGGAAPSNAAQPANAQLTLRVSAHTSDGSVVTNVFTVPVLSAVAPALVSDVGSAQFRQGGNANLIAVLQ